MNKTDKERNNRKWLIILLIIGIVVCLLVAGWALFFREGPAPLTPDYPPQGTEENQTPIDGDNGDKLDSPEGGGAISVTYGTAVTVDLSDETVTLYYANPQASNQNVAILIMLDGDEELVVAKSELINPGNQVTQLALDEYAKTRLQAGGYNATLVIRAYDPESGEKAMVDTKGEITLTVQD